MNSDAMLKVLNQVLDTDEHKPYRRQNVHSHVTVNNRQLWEHLKRSLSAQELNELRIKNEMKTKGTISQADFSQHLQKLFKKYPLNPK